MNNICTKGRSLGLILLVVAGGLAAACNSSGPGPLDSVSAPPDRGGLQGAPADRRSASFDEIQDPRAYCPKTVMRAGTETYNIYPDKMAADDPERQKKLRFRATITEVARECNYGGPNLFIRVGVAGRVLSGPSGETGVFQLPVRIAVTRGDELLYTKLHDVTAEIPPGRTNNTFSVIDSDILLPRPENENIIIYAGFDGQRVDIPGDRSVQEDLDPIN